MESLMEYVKVGTVDITGLKTQIEWRIDDFAANAECIGEMITYESPSFMVENTSWVFRLFFEYDYDSYDEVTLFIVNPVLRQYTIEYELGLKKWNGSVEYLIDGIMEGHKTGSGPLTLLTVSDLLQRKSELAPNNVLTVMCTLKRANINSIQASGLDRGLPLKLISLDKLSENLKDLYADKETCDVTLKVQDKEFKAHRLLLMARSRVFAATFKHDTLERQTGVILITDCDPDSFQDFLDYLYSGKLEELSFRSALNLYYTSDKYDVKELKAFCIEYLMQCLTVETACEIAVLADKCDEAQLFNVVQCFFNEKYVDIFLTPEWERLMTEDSRLANKLLTEMAKMKRKNLAGVNLSVLRENFFEEIMRGRHDLFYSLKF